MVWLDADLRNELMIIYSEDLRLTGYRIEDPTEGGIAVNKRTPLLKSLHERALSSFKVE